MSVKIMEAEAIVDEFIEAFLDIGQRAMNESEHALTQEHLDAFEVMLGIAKVAYLMNLHVQSLVDGYEGSHGEGQ